MKSLKPLINVITRGYLFQTDLYQCFAHVSNECYFIFTYPYYFDKKSFQQETNLMLLTLSIK